MIVARRCDVPMARSKGFLPCKGGDCKSCVACIVRDEQGNEGHALGSPTDRPDPKLLARNMKLRGFYGKLDW